MGIEHFAWLGINGNGAGFSCPLSSLRAPMLAGRRFAFVRI